MINDSNAAELVEKFVTTKLPERIYPEDRFDGRGVVIAAGGVKFQLGAWVVVNMLRDHGCKLPIEIWYLGPREYNAAWERLLQPLDVRCVDAYEVRKKVPHERLHGWELKPYAIQHSRFEEVLFLDADNCPIRDPSFLFDSQPYKDNGAVFWPDYGRLGRDRLAWRVFGNIEYRNEPEFESGQIVLDKSRCWQCLELCHWYMQNSNNFFFRHVHGDKEVFHLAWRKLGQPYAMPSRGIHSLDSTMCQHDFDGERLFQHRNLAKWSVRGNRRIKGFKFEAECIGHVKQLASQWSPAAQTLPTDDDRQAIQALDGRQVQYIRMINKGLGRPVQFRSSDGTFDEGANERERYWTIRDDRLLIAGDDGRLTMDLQPEAWGGWSGRWLLYEQMPILVIPLDRT